jgi:uncharacterized protein YggE
MRIALSASLALALSLAAAPAFAAEWQPSSTGQVSVDATIYHDAKPDQISMTVNCSVNDPAPKATLRENFGTTMKSLAEIVGGNGTVRRSGIPYFYDYYGSTGTKTDDYTGSMDMMIVNMSADAATKVQDRLAEFGCTGSWDIRLTSATSFARQYKDQLLAQIKDKQSLYEELLGVKLSRVSNVTVYTSMDGYNTFDPETGMVRAMTTMSVTFDLGTGAAR